MNKDRLLAVGTLPTMWIIYFIFELITGRIHDTFTVMMNLVTAALFALIGLFAYKVGMKNSSGFKNKKLWVIFVILFLIEQGSKLIIKLKFFDYNFILIKDFLYFSPIINTQGSWLNARFAAGVSFSSLIILNAAALILFLEIYRYSISKKHKDFWIDMSYVFLITGCLSSLIDKLFYGGSLDFIGISDLFVADIKDIYINIGIFFLFMALYFNGYFTNKDTDSTVKEDLQELKKFISFMSHDIKAFIYRDR